MVMIKAIAFDLDGVLLDMCEAHKWSLNQALRKWFDYEIPDELHYGVLNGLPTMKKLYWLADNKIIPIDGKSFNAVNWDKQQFTLQYIDQKLEPVQQKIDMLKWLTENDYVCTCVTNSIRKTSIAMLKKTGLWEYIAVLLANDDVPENKPSPVPYIIMGNRLRMNLNEMLIVEDSPHGIESAKASGYPYMKVKDPSEVTLTNLLDYIGVIR